MQGLAQDICDGIRQLLRSRGSSAVAVLTLALGVGASTAAFSVVDAALLRPLPYPHPEQLVTLSVEFVHPDGRVDRSFGSLDDVRLWQQSDDVVAAVAMHAAAFNGRIVDGPEPERIQVAQVTEQYLSMLGVAPVLGRDFTIADMDPGAPAVALLSHGYWRSRFESRPDAIGETIRLNDGDVTVVGVLPSWFGVDTPITRTLRTEHRGSRSIYARLQPGVTIQQGAATLSARMTGQAQSDGSVLQPRVRVRSRLAQETRGSRATVNVLLGAVGVILLIACANTAGLLLARGASRQSEFAVRAALGAGRLRLVRQLLTESAVLALAGAAIGVALAWWSIDIIAANVPLTLPANSTPTLNVGVLAATIALLVPTTILFGLVPAVRLSRVRLSSTLARAGRQRGTALSRRGGQVLIAAEVALAVILVAGAALMLRSFARLHAVDLGFKPDGLVTMQVLPLEPDPGVHGVYYRDLLQRIRASPGIESAGLVDWFALGMGESVTTVRGTGEAVQVGAVSALPGYLEAIGATLREGRLPTQSDDSAGLRGVVVNESAARVLFPDGPAVGRDFQRPRSGGAEVWTILGVIADFRHGGPTSRQSPQIFFPLTPTSADVNNGMMMLIRPSGGMHDLADRLRRTAHAIGPRVLVERISSADELFGLHVVTPRRRTVWLGMLGGLALSLAVAGVFGMTAYAVARRTPEIGVRIAFGARPAQVVRTMVRDAATPIVIGTLVGLGGAALGTRVIATFLFDTTPTDPMTFAAVALTLLTAGCLAALVPALRAARVDPVAALRAE